MICDLQERLEKLGKWQRGEDGGSRDVFQDANLGDADLGGANLVGANLVGANLGGAYLVDTDLRYATLRYANLRGAYLGDTDLRGANLDFSCWPLWCGSLRAKADDRLVIQLLYHTLSLAQHSEISAELKDALNTPALIQQANRFHRVHECGRLEMWEEEDDENHG